MSTTTDHARQVIAGNVRAILGRRKSSQTQLASVLGMSQAAVSRRLGGGLPFDTDELLSICEHYRVPLADLFDGIEFNDDGSPRIHDPVGEDQMALFDFAA